MESRLHSPRRPRRRTLKRRRLKSPLLTSESSSRRPIAPTAALMFRTNIHHTFGSSTCRPRLARRRRLAKSPAVSSAKVTRLGRRTAQSFFYTSNREAEPYYKAQDSDVHSVAAAGGESTKIASIDGPIRGLSISPDGKRLAFVGTLSGNPIRSYSQPDLWVLTLDGSSAPRNLTVDYDFDIGGGVGGDQHAPAGGQAGGKPFWTAMARESSSVHPRKERPIWCGSTRPVARFLITPMAITTCLHTQPQRTRQRCGDHFHTHQHWRCLFIRRRFSSADQRTLFCHLKYRRMKDIANVGGCGNDRRHL